ncbi:MAG: pirin-like C-terminal cupin domain-containing protein [Saprospiraceae bacterium]
MLINRKLVHIDTPLAHQGFLGKDHTARALIQNNFLESDPFILLMDDILDKQDDEPIGGPHPHAGFETVSLLLAGEVGDPAHQMKSGDFQIMTAGSGIIHTETIKKKSKMHLLQLWLNLPKEKRWVTPRVQDISLDKVPEVTEDGLFIKVYSGSFAGATSPVHNYVPLIVADIQMRETTSIINNIPASFNAFLIVLEGSLKIGNEEDVLVQGQVGWLDKHSGNGQSELKLVAGTCGVRVILYAGQPQGDKIISHGPFIGDKNEDITRLYKEYRDGKMKNISTVAGNQRIKF